MNPIPTQSAEDALLALRLITASLSLICLYASFLLFSVPTPKQSFQGQLSRLLTSPLENWKSTESGRNATYCFLFFGLLSLATLL
jgi:hypothetical protein